MLQGIEKTQEKRISRNAVTVMFHDRIAIFGDFAGYLSRACEARSLSGALAMIHFWGADRPSLSLLLSDRQKHWQNPHVAQPASLSGSKKVFAEQLVERSARLVSEAPVTTRGNIAASSIEQITEQRCCIAA